MILPGPVRAGVELALEARLGRPVVVDQAAPVGGGCISPTARIRTTHGDTFFLKWGEPELPDALLAAEADALRRLAAADAVRVPVVIEVGPTDGQYDDRGGGRADGPDGGHGAAWLLLEWLEPGEPSPGSWERLGRELASLHRSRADRFGADAPNFIGSLPQRNDPARDWAGFWRDRRLAPQLRYAYEAGLIDDDDRRRFDRLFERLPTLLGPAGDDGASLLHGDLWRGNVHMLSDGTPALIDPSAYHGHREVDLAMAELFGGFGNGFMDAYREAWPLAPGYAPARRAAYQLYYLLVHVNLFGRGYVAGTRRALGEAGV